MMMMINLTLYSAKTIEKYSKALYIKFKLLINHKNYNFRKKKNSQVMKERENLH